MSLRDHSFKVLILNEIHGVIYGTGLRRINGINKARRAVLLRWRREDRSRYFLQHIVPHSTHKFAGDFERNSCLLVHSYSHIEPDEDFVPRAPSLVELDESTIPHVRTRGG